jgi:ribonuclease HI
LARKETILLRQQSKSSFYRKKSEVKVDASIRNGIGGSGVVIRINIYCSVYGSFNAVGFFDVEHAELLAIQKGIRFAHELGLLRFQVKLDCQYICCLEYQFQS